MDNNSLDPRSAALKEMVAYSSPKLAQIQLAGLKLKVVNKQRTAHVSCKAAIALETKELADKGGSS
jgi:hypothetical protein